MLRRALSVLSFVTLITGALAETPLAEVVNTTAFVQIEADSFSRLSLKQQILAYWLSQSSIAIEPIIYDQLSRFGLRQKRVLEVVISNGAKVDPEIYGRILNFTKLFWANKGNHNQISAQKFLPNFTAGELKQALAQAERQDLVPEVDALARSLFDAQFEPLTTSRNPVGGKDILQASANNFYLGVTLADLNRFSEHYLLNSRVVKQGKVGEQVYRAGTPDGRVPPGLYARYLKKANELLEKARLYAEPAQARVISDLIRYYQTGEHRDWVRFNMDWARDSEPVDFGSGFIDVSHDARGAKGAVQSFVVIKDRDGSKIVDKIAANFQYFKDQAPGDARYKRQGAKPPVTNVVEPIIGTGDFPLTTMGYSLPKDDEMRTKFGSKSFLFFDDAPTMAGDAVFTVLEEFASSPAQALRGRKFGVEAEKLMTIMHEAIGYDSGSVSLKPTQGANGGLKEYFYPLEEARADLVALWNVFDPKVKELGLVSSDEVGTTMYDIAVLRMLIQLRHIPEGDTIENPRERARQLIVRYIMDRTGAIGMEDRNGKTYVYVKSYRRMREGVGMLLAELTRIKAESDYPAIKALVEDYGAHFDPKLRDEIVRRSSKFNIPTYYAGINPELTAEFDPAGSVTKVRIEFPHNYLKQQLSYSAMYPER